MAVSDGKKFLWFLLIVFLVYFAMKHPHVVHHLLTQLSHIGSKH
jgi:hypothetical protein